MLRIIRKMRDKKIQSTGLCLIVSVLILVSCGGPIAENQPAEGNQSKEGLGAGVFEESIDIDMMVLKGPSAISTVKLMEDNDSVVGSAYHFQIAGAPDEVVSAISSSSTDIAVVPTNLAATLYSKTEGDISMVAITTLGSLYLVENGQSIQSVEDLRGKTIYSAGQGASPQFILEHLISTTGLTLGEDVFVEYVAEQSEVVVLFAAGEAEIVLLPEPFTSVALSKVEEARIALDLSEAWKAENGDDFAMSCVIARASFIEENPEAIKAVLDDLRASVDYVSEDLAAVAQLCVRYDIIADYDIAYSAIPNCRIVYKDGAEMESFVKEYFEVLYIANPSSIGGSVPDEGLYYIG